MSEKICTRCHKPHDEDTKQCAACKEQARGYDHKRVRPPEHQEYQKRYREYHREKAREYAAGYREKNHDVIVVKKHEYHLKNRDKILKKMRGYYPHYYAANKETLLANNRQRRVDNLEKVRECERRSARKHPEPKLAAKHKRRALKKGNGGSYTEKEIDDLYLWQQGHCHYCGDWLYKSDVQAYLGVLIHPKVSYHRDHKIPIIRHGSNYISNIALSCPGCNWEKNDKTEEEFFREMNT